MTLGIVLAGGDASRMMPLTKNRPKSMLLVGGKPLVQYAIEALQSMGVTQFRIVLGEDGVRVRTFLGDGSHLGVHIEYVSQSRPDGPANAVALALQSLQSVDQDLLVVPGNCLIRPKDLEALQHSRGNVLLLAPAGGSHEQGLPVLRGHDLQGMEAGTPVPHRSLVSTGIFRLTPEAVRALGTWSERSMDGWLGDLSQRVSIHVEILDAPWIPVVQPQDLLVLNERILDDLGVHHGQHVHVHPSAVIVPPVQLGDGTHVGENAVVGPYVSTRTNCRIGALTELRDSILNNNVIVDSRSVVRNAILDDGVVIGANCVLTEGTILAPDQRIAPGTTVVGTTAPIVIKHA